MRPTSHLVAALTSLAPLLASCDQVAQAFNCDPNRADYQQSLTESAVLSSAIPESSDSYPMALVLSQTAVNSLFQRIADTELPELSDGVEVLGQTIEISVRPSLPLLQVGGNASCPSCFGASLPFALGVSINGAPASVGSGEIAAQMPIRLAPTADASRTALLAEFQNSTVLSLQLDVQDDTINDILDDYVSPIASQLVTAWARTRFSNTSVAEVGTWRLGNGAIALAGRGPIVRPESRTIVLAMQSNLPAQNAVSANVPSELPEGAEIGIVIRPELLLAMARRLTYEGVIPNSYNALGQPAEGGDVHLGLSNLTSDTGLLRPTVRLWKTDSYCGAANLSASLGLSVSPSGVAFSLSDVAVDQGSGTGVILQQSDQLAGRFLETLAEKMSVTANYREIFGGELREQPSVETFRASLDARGITVYLDLL